MKFACELKDFDPTEWIDKRKARKIDRFAQMIVAAARQAEADSGIDIAGETERTGVSVATGIGGLGSFQDCAYTLKDRGADRVNPQSIPAIIPNMGAAWVSMELGTRGPLTSQCTACAASNMAIGEATDAIRLGRADVMLAGGTEAGITEVGIAGFGAMRALSRRNDAPEKGEPPVRPPAATASSWARRARSSSSRSSSTRRRAARRSTRRSPATASRRTPSTSPSPTRPGMHPCPGDQDGA